MAATKDIPRDEWVRTLDAFSKQHEGWIVELEAVGADLGDQEESSGLPLVGISADVKNLEPRIEAMVGGRFDVHLTTFGTFRPSSASDSCPEKPEAVSRCQRAV